ncbi:hypothetical protein [Pseudoalteromonas peptidolytica]|uniref:hypothetical protein n=1 Tax=Pseudoalteromonas peptidolytica TaxID=61150 RepID=UPI00298DFC23|nr:hypothetical protein [Pseudoalteromonas peptidolytica]MDW7548206.1 hypothetical protein [Pseudoalteromonas peptidolytica]
MRIYYQITTQDPVIVSQSNATTNNHNTCDFIPGSAILGALAAKLYPELADQQDTSWAIFHSGAVQFSPCYPLVGDEVALPIPASWHIEKGRPIFEHAKLNQQTVNIPSVLYAREETQYKQLRSGFITSNGDEAQVNMGQVTKTAINNESGTVELGQLYSYSYIEQGQTFVGWIETPASYQSLIEDALCKVTRIGRAKNTEFGRVTVTPITGKVAHPQALRSQLVLWCMADCEFLDEFGNSCLSPSGKMIDPLLDGITLNIDQSYIRSHTMARFNQKRQSFDSQSQVISKGSVLVFELNGHTPTQATLNKIATSGLGINKQFGQGWVMVNPSWYQTKQLNLSSLYSPLLVAPVKPKKLVDDHMLAESTLLKWVTEQQAAEQSKANAKEATLELLQVVAKAYESARGFNSMGKHLQVGPTLTQWNKIGELVKADIGDWKAQAFEGEHCICKAKNDEFGWGIEWQGDTGYTNFADTMSAVLAHHSTAVMRLFLEQLCQYDPSTFDGLKRFKAYLSTQSQGGN